MDKIKILLIEDDSFLSGMYATKFEIEGFEVYAALDGATGLKMVKEVRPDIILLDIMMPEMNGFEVLKAIKKDKATDKIPVILLTNLSQKEDIEQGLSLGANDYLIKAHFMPSEVVTKINKILNKE